MEDLHAKTLDCVHCGLCLSACPTYLETGNENASPRGRVYLMRGMAEGKLPLQGTLAQEAFNCLGCRACETACPSGVEYGNLLEQTRAQLVAEGVRSGVAYRLERALLRHLVPYRGRVRAAVRAAALLQRTGVDRFGLALLARVPGLGQFATRLRATHALMPPIPATADRAPLPPFVAAEGKRRGRVAFLTGCIMPEMFGAAHRASLRVLAHNGFEVSIPRSQGCCGALQAHSGDLDFARELARENARALRGDDIDAIIVNSAGCGAAMREADRWLGSEGAAYAGKVRDISEFLSEAGLVAPPHPVEARVCYDDPCHLIHAQRVEAAPRELLREISGLELVAHREASVCCGAAGIYNLTHRAMSEQVLERKMAALAEVDPDIIASGNPGCLMQLRAGALGRGLRAEVLHPMQLLDWAYTGERPQR